MTKLKNLSAQDKWIELVGAFGCVDDFKVRAVNDGNNNFAVQLGRQ